MRSDPTKILDNTTADPESAQVIRKPVTIPVEPGTSGGNDDFSTDRFRESEDFSTKNDRELDVEAVASEMTDSEAESAATRKPIKIESKPEGESE